MEHYLSHRKVESREVTEWLGASIDGGLEIEKISPSEDVIGKDTKSYQGGANEEGRIASARFL